MPIPSFRGALARNREAALLGAGALVALFALVLVYLATVKPLEETGPKLTSGEIVNLNDLKSSDQLLPVLDVLDSSAERSFVAREIWKRAHEGNFPNVGELSRIRVSASEIEGDRRLEGLRGRLEAAQRRARPEDAASVTIPLLSLQQIREVKPRLVVRTPGEFRSSFWLWSALFLLAFTGVHAVWRVRRFEGDQLILPALLVLTAIGLVVMVSIRDPLRDLPIFRTFVQGVLGGVALMIAGSLVNWERSPLRRRSFAPLFAAFGVSVVLILFGSGPGGSDAKVNLFGFQPVEVIKILIVLFLAGYFFDRWEFLRELPETRGALPGVLRKLGIPKLEYLLPPLLAIGLVLIFFFLQRDLGPALILSFLFLILYCVARGQPWMALAGTAVIVAAFAIGYKLGIPHTVSGRLSMWLSPWDNSFRGGDHLAQGLWALAGGALTGTGLGLGQPQRVPEVHTDLVLAAVGEELGFLGLLAVLALWTLLIWRGFRAAFRAGGIYSFFLALGLSVLVAVQTLLITGGVLGVFPLSGVVSPFLSFGAHGHAGQLPDPGHAGGHLGPSGSRGHSLGHAPVPGSGEVDGPGPGAGARRHPRPGGAGAGAPGRPVPHPGRADDPGGRLPALPVQPAAGGHRPRHPPRQRPRQERRAPRDQRSGRARKAAGHPGAGRGHARSPGEA